MKYTTKHMLYETSKLLILAFMIGVVYVQYWLIINYEFNNWTDSYKYILTYCIQSIVMFIALQVESIQVDGNFDKLDDEGDKFGMFIFFIFSPVLSLLIPISFILEFKNPYHSNYKLKDKGSFTEYLISRVSNHPDCNMLVAEWLVKHKERKVLSSTSYYAYLNGSDSAGYDVCGNILVNYKCDDANYYREPTKEEIEYYSILLGIDKKFII